MLGLLAAREVTWVPVGCGSLEEVHRVIEHRVAERTMRLFEANAVLREAIEARTKIEIELRAAGARGGGRLVAGVAYEISTPVQFVSDSIQFAAPASSDLLALIENYQVVVLAVLSGAGQRDRALDADIRPS